MNSRFSAARNDESGFTLVELLVVIAIIAILTAIAVPSFLSQRQKANAAAVRSDMKNIVTTIETGLVDQSGVVVVTTSGSTASVVIGSGTSAPVKLSSGVSVVSGVAASNTAARYTLEGSHSGNTTAKIWYDSAGGGFVTSAPTA